jgi:hypothetical protein
VDATLVGSALYDSLPDHRRPAQQYQLLRGT